MTPHFLLEASMNHKLWSENESSISWIDFIEYIIVINLWFSGLSSVGTFKQYYPNIFELTSVYNGCSLYVSAKWEGKRTYKTRENQGNYDDQYLIEWVSFRQTWKCMLFGPSRLKILNLPENQNRKFGGLKWGRIEFQTFVKGEGDSLPPLRPPSLII